MPNLNLTIGKVIENLMGDSYHSLYHKDPEILGQFFLKDTQFSNGTF